MENEGVEVVEVSDSDASEIIDNAARHNLGMTGDEFRSAWEAGTLEGDPDRPEVMRVAMLLPLLGR